MTPVEALKISRGPAFVLMATGVYWGGLAGMMPDVKAHVGASDGVMGAVLVAPAAASILAIESRHAGYMNVLVNAPLSNGDESFQSAISLTAAAHTIAPFFANPAIPVSLASAVSSVSSLPNDIRILKFALALEYLQAEYYNVNVPIYFG